MVFLIFLLKIYFDFQMSIIVYRLRKTEEGVYLRIVHVNPNIERDGNILIIFRYFNILFDIIMTPLPLFQTWNAVLLLPVY